MTTTQAVLAGLCSLGFVALGAIAVRSALRARRLPAPARWAVAAVLLVLVLVSWGSTLAPRTYPDAGTVCIEEPLFGMAADSDLATDGCLSVNREAVADRLLGAAALALVAVVGGRVASPAGRRDPPARPPGGDGVRGRRSSTAEPGASRASARPARTRPSRGARG